METMVGLCIVGLERCGKCGAGQAAIAPHVQLSYLSQCLCQLRLYYHVGCLLYITGHLFWLQPSVLETFEHEQKTLYGYGMPRCHGCRHASFVYNILARNLVGVVASSGDSTQYDCQPVDLERVLYL